MEFPIFLVFLKRLLDYEGGFTCRLYSLGRFCIVLGYAVLEKYLGAPYYRGEGVFHFLDESSIDLVLVIKGRGLDRMV